MSCVKLMIWDVEFAIFEAFCARFFSFLAEFCLQIMNWVKLISYFGSFCASFLSLTRCVFSDIYYFGCLVCFVYVGVCLSFVSASLLLSKGADLKIRIW